jgi:hypothetical protein
MNMDLFIYVFCKNALKKFNFRGTYGSPMTPPFILYKRCEAFEPSLYFV